jgi:hypothetical protein
MNEPNEFDAIDRDYKEALNKLRRTRRSFTIICTVFGIGMVISALGMILFFFGIVKGVIHPPLWKDAYFIAGNVLFVIGIFILVFIIFKTDRFCRRIKL